MDEWGTNEAYSQTTSPVALGAGGEAVMVTTELYQLTPGVAYHFRLVATNVAGASNGRDAVFQTPVVLLAGDNPLTNECHRSFADPGARTMVAPLAIAAGSDFSVALKFDGTVAAWGD